MSDYGDERVEVDMVVRFKWTAFTTATAASNLVAALREGGVNAMGEAIDAYLDGDPVIDAFVIESAKWSWNGNQDESAPGKVER